MSQPAQKQVIEHYSTQNPTDGAPIQDLGEVVALKRPAASNFSWEDPLLLADQLTDDERMIRDTARDFA